MPGKALQFRVLDDFSLEYFMPIYAYRCEACGFARDVLQKMSDDALTICPSCDQPRFRKQLTAAGFQLKGSGWYVTDFRGNGGADSTAASGTSPAAEAPVSSEAGTTAFAPATQAAPASATADPSSS
jgi:putative FmdB family regulatory protein